MDIFNLNTYDYHLPQNLIAQTPLMERDSSKLLIYNRKEKSVSHSVFTSILDHLEKGDCLVQNITKVIPARLIGRKTETDAKIEVLLLKRINITTWEALIKPCKRVKAGTVVVFSPDLSLTVGEDADFFGGKIVSFNFSGNFEEILDRIGSMPLPHYIHEKLENKERYQTIYSKIDGSSAAPTAGLHFTKELLQKIADKGVRIVEVLLHVGLGTFRPVSDENILNHEMHYEYFEISEDSANAINTAKQNGNKIVAVGTTSVRALESAADKNGLIVPQKKETNIFIYPGYKFVVVDAIITNFHLPKSTLIMLVSAFCGVEQTLLFYNEAVKNNYRFFSFGDACLLL